MQPSSAKRMPISMDEFPFALAETVASAYAAVADLLEAQADANLRAFAAPDEGFSGPHAEDVRQRVGSLAQTEHSLAEDARQAAGTVRDLIAEARVAAQRGQSRADTPSHLHSEGLWG